MQEGEAVAGGCGVPVEGGADVGAGGGSAGDKRVSGAGSVDGDRGGAGAELPGGDGEVGVDGPFDRLRDRRIRGEKRHRRRLRRRHRRRILTIYILTIYY